MAIQTNFPAVKPALLLDFANTKRLDPRITFTRTTTATYYDGVTTAKAEENLVTYSQEFDNAGWVKTNLSVTANDTTAPDGTSTADKFTDDATNIAHRVVGTYLGLVGSTTYAFSAFLKKGTNNFAYIGFRDGATNNRYIAAAFNLDTGVAGDTFNPGSGTLVGSTITNIGNGWYRCSVIGSLSGTSVTTPQFIIGLSTAATGISLGGFLGEAYVGTGSTIYAWGAQLEQRSSVTAYTATTTQPITNYIPVLQTASAGQARFDHNPVTRESLGFLAEEQRTNLVTYSAQFDNAAWTKTSISASANTVVSPDGTISGDRLTEASGLSQKYIRTPNNFAAGAATVSVYVKCDLTSAQRYICLEIYNVTDGVRRVFANPNTGTITLTTATTGSATSSISSVGNGWYRVSVSATMTATSSSYIYITNSSVSVSGYTGDDYSGFFVWGAQLEAGAFATSYIPTVASSATRNADVVVMSGTNFTSWFNDTEGTIYVEAATSSFASTAIWAIGNNTLSFGSGNMMYEAYSSASSVSAISVIYNGSSQVSGLNSGSALTLNTFSRGAFAYKTNDFAKSTNGATVSTDTSGVLPVGVTGISIGNFTYGWVGASNFLNGTIKKLAYYRKRLTNSQLQNLTS